ncbi:MAG: hypothetical protein IJ678_05005 [Kiritimatiellae bacterium]|nr:hypothetical protein [Kiritimatiellia bacterium]
MSDETKLHRRPIPAFKANASTCLCLVLSVLLFRCSYMPRPRYSENCFTELAGTWSVSTLPESYDWKKGTFDENAAFPTRATLALHEDRSFSMSGWDLLDIRVSDGTPFYPRGAATGKWSYKFDRWDGFGELVLEGGGNDGGRFLTTLRWQGRAAADHFLLPRPNDALPQYALFKTEGSPAADKENLSGSIDD